MKQTYAYLRVSTAEQNTARQRAALKASKYKFDKSFTDKASGKDTNRPNFKALMEKIRREDTVVIHSLDRLGRSVSDMCSIVESLNAKGVTLVSLKDNLTFDDKFNPMRDLQMHMLSAFAEFERSLIRERQAEGIAAKKKRGEPTGRPPVDAEKVQKVDKLKAKGIGHHLACKEVGIGSSTYYKLKSEKKKVSPRN